MRVSSLLSLALVVASSGCTLPRPVPAPDYQAACPSSSMTPAAGSLLFATLRLPDCRNLPQVLMTSHRSTSAHFGAVIDGEMSFHDRTTWIRSAREQLIAAAKLGRPGVIFIHGYNTGHQKALERASAIRTATERDRPVIALTWPSYASEAKYFWDEANAEWTSIQMRGLLAELVGETPVIIVAHSMGNRIALDAVRSMRRRDGSSPVKELIMAAPDVDRDALGSELRAHGGLAGAVTVYGSRRDQPLSASWRAHGHARAGDLSRWVAGRDPEYGPFAEINGVTVVDTTDVSRDFWSHAAFIETYEGAADLCRVLRGLPTKPWRKPASESASNVWSLVPNPASSDGCSRPGYDAAMQLARQGARSAN